MKRILAIVFCIVISSVAFASNEFDEFLKKDEANEAYYENGVQGRFERQNIRVNLYLDYLQSDKIKNASQGEVDAEIAYINSKIGGRSIINWSQFICDINLSFSKLKNLSDSAKLITINFYERFLDEILITRAAESSNVIFIDELVETMFQLSPNEKFSLRILNKYKNNFPKECASFFPDLVSYSKWTENDKKVYEMHKKRRNKLSQDVDKIVLFYWASISSSGEKNSNYPELLNALKGEDLRLYNMKLYFNILKSAKERKDTDAENILCEKIKNLSSGKVKTANSHSLNMELRFGGDEYMISAEKNRTVSKPMFKENHYLPPREKSEFGTHKTSYIFECHNINSASGKEKHSGETSILFSLNDDIYLYQNTGDYFGTEFNLRARPNEDSRDFVDIEGVLFFHETSALYTGAVGYWFEGTIPLGQEIELKNEHIFLKINDTDVKYFIKITRQDLYNKRMEAAVLEPIKPENQPFAEEN